MGKCPLKTAKNTQPDANDKWTASTELFYQQVKEIGFKEKVSNFNEETSRRYSLRLA